jgi:hypothetical protein
MTGYEFKARDTFFVAGVCTVERVGRTVSPGISKLPDVGGYSTVVEIQEALIVSTSFRRFLRANPSLSH